MRTVTLRRPDGRAGSYRDWLRAEATRWAAASDDERTASQAAARTRYADLNKDRPKAQDQSGATVLLVYDEIGFWGITAADLVADLMTIPGDLELHLNTPGGDVFDGIAIANALKQRAGQVKVVIDGLAASIGSVIAMAASPGGLVMMPNATMMIHDAWGLCIGDADDMAEMKAVLDQQSDNIAGIYAARSGKPAGDWRAVMKAESWMVGQEAVDAGLADVLGIAPAAAAAAVTTGPIAGLQVIVMDGSAAPQQRPAARPRGADDGGGQDDEGACKTCGGTGRQRHPQTGQFTEGCSGCGGTGKASAEEGGDAAQNAAPDDDDDTCPTCDGTGEIREGHVECPDCGGTGKVPDGERDRAARRVTAGARVLGIESMPIEDEALPVHHTATVDEAWDGPAAVAAMPNDATVLRYCHAWQDSSSDDGTSDDPDGDADDQKSSYKFPHHKTKGGPANLAACRNGLARLSGADIPDGDRAGVKAHLQAHLDDGSKDDDDSASDHAHLDLSGVDLEQLGNALKGALK